MVMGARQRGKPEQRQLDLCAAGIEAQCAAAVVRIVQECALLPVWKCREGGPAAVRMDACSSICVL